MTKTMTLEEVAQAMVAPGKGILAADESTGTIKKRFDSIKAESTADTRRDYREMMFRSTEAMKSHISGVILYDETLRQKAKDGTPLAKVIESTGALPGIKVDAGTKPLPFCPGEVITEGLDGLRDRIKDYVSLGAKFAKWRAVIDIGKNMPSYNCINANAQALARYAALCVEGGLVPIVEPEVLMDGDHDIDTCEKVTRVDAEGDLPPALLRQGAARADGPQAQHGDIRQEVREAGEPAGGGRAHGQGPEALRAGGGAGHRLPVGRPVRRGRHGAPLADEPAGPVALEAVVLLRPRAAGGCLKAWGGKPENVAAGQRAFAHRAKMNGVATLGKWTEQLEKAA